MHLKQLKLSGFKSFVDSVIIPFPSRLAAVVGPNGCGKSNIIDAVRWVMGESSAKTLRGESMVDVIFNGSANRRALGQASVELTFDNSMGRLTGQFAGYGEIAVKRVVNREGESQYFLNNSRCRRRDITDIFLGTGAGSRGYSIIGQGTISRLIEARPEELRAYLEEAAGVSKYRERRRETVARMENTRENLLRVADIREELGKQLARLERQASAARRYHALKAEEKQVRLEIIACKQQQLYQQLEQLRATLRQHETDYESAMAQVTDAIQRAEAARSEQVAQNQTVDTLQQQFYQLGTELARLEEHQQQQQREKQRLQTQLYQTQDEWHNTNSQLQHDSEALTASEKELRQHNDNFATLTEDYQHALQQYQQQEQQISARLQAINQAQLALQQAVSHKDVTELSLKHAYTRQHEAQLQIEKLSKAQQQEDCSASEQKLLTLRQQAQDSAAKVQDIKSQVDSLHAVLSQQQQEADILKKALQQAQENALSLRSEHAAAKARLDALLKGTTHNEPSLLCDKPRLAEILGIEPQWLTACELVLADTLQAAVVEEMTDVWALLEEHAALTLHVTARQNADLCAREFPRLIDKMQGMPPAMAVNLNHVYAADSLNEALQWLRQLDAHESIITKEGCWIGQHWCKSAAKTPDNHSILKLRQASEALARRLAEAECQLQRLSEKHNSQQQLISQTQQQLEEAAQSLSEQTDTQNTLQAQINTTQALHEQSRRRQSQLQEELEQLHEKLEDAVAQQMQLQQVLDEAVLACEQQKSQLSDNSAEQTRWQTQLQTMKAKTISLQQQSHQQELHQQRLELKIQNLQQAVGKGTEQLAYLQERLEDLRQQQQCLNQPEGEARHLLDEKIQHHQAIEQQLNGARDTLTQLNDRVQTIENESKTNEARARAILEKIAQLRIEQQTLLTREAALLDTLSDYDVVAAGLPAFFKPQMTLAEHEAHLLSLLNKLKALGAVNLAAIEEFNTENERRQQLDNQYQDLTDALQMLEEAIAKIDRETRARLRETFDAVNEGFQKLFPRLFGGGCACLQLTCDNLLEAGVLVMAQPPGKRNSTIHLLSGGEKAMTAVALVFAIFQLNPSPFCLLDEVDAPLDDVNVGRFCALVKEMSQCVQFLFITHNKVTMELADHLIGVTMREPGVSRVVAVDVEQALSLVENQLEE